MGLLAMSLANCAERGRRVFDHWFESRAWHGHIPSRVRVMLGDMADNYRAYRVLHGGDEYSSLPRPPNPYVQPRSGVRTPNPRDPCSGPIFSGDGPPPTKVDRCIMPATCDTVRLCSSMPVAALVVAACPYITSVAEVTLLAATAVLAETHVSRSYPIL